MDWLKFGFQMELQREMAAPKNETAISRCKFEILTNQ